MCNTFMWNLCAPPPDEIRGRRHPGRPVRLSNCPPATNRPLSSGRDRRQPEFLPRRVQRVPPRYVVATTAAIRCDEQTLWCEARLKASLWSLFRSGSAGMRLLRWSSPGPAALPGGRLQVRLCRVDSLFYLRASSSMLGLNTLPTLIHGVRQSHSPGNLFQ